MSAAPTLPAADTARAPLLTAGQAVLAGLLAVEVVIFSVIGTNFLSATNAFEVTRLTVEIGLLALALTPVIVTGGIDLSVGSLLGLSAVLLGKMWHDAGLSVGLAALGALAVGAAGGGLNALLITRLRIPPLIVTLGSYSLFRGLAEGLTGGTDIFTGFPEAFLTLGRGAQVPVFLLVAAGFWLLLHRTTTGRALSAIGFAPEGARHAGIQVERQVALAYVLSGLAAGLAAVIYVARVGQAKSDAGINYELLAITAVVLGGTSIFGGRGSIPGTLLGLFAIAVLKRGVRLADLPAELAEALTGVLLLAAISLDWRSGRAAVAPHPSAHEKEEILKNSQVAVLSVVILAAAVIVAASNFWIVQSLRPGGAGASATVTPVTIAMMPKSKGNAYFVACRKGAEQAAQELGVKLIWDGPTDADPAKQIEIIETWITRKVDVIAVAVENRKGISPVLARARKEGIKVVTWDADADPDARDFFVNQATPQGIGSTLMDDAARVMGGKGQFAIISGSQSSSNLNEWLEYVKARRAEKYPDLELATVQYCDDLQKIAFDKTNSILKNYPQVKLIMAICSPAVPGAAEAVKQLDRSDVKVIGLGLPNDNKAYVHAGITDCVVLWNTHDLGYLTVYASRALKEGTLKPGDKQFQAGRLGSVEIQGDNILLGKPLTFTKNNIDQFDF